MNIVPGPAQAVAICLSAALPLLLLAVARATSVRGAGRTFRIGVSLATALFVLASLVLPGERHFDDVLAGALLLATGILLSYVFWSLLAWGFTLTLLTSLVQAGRPMTSDEWATAYMRGGNLGTFARNRLKLLLGSGMVASSDGKLVATAKGTMVAGIVRLIRFVTGLGHAP